MPRQIAASFASLFFGIFAAGSAAAAPVDDLVKSCSQCHGANGVASAANVPHLNGQLSDYLEQEISALGSEERKTLVPYHVPKTWSRTEISAVAKFYAASKAERPKQDTDPQKVAQGAEIYKQRCAECHVDGGRKSDKDAPLMAAQSLAYMSEQTKLFVAGKRRFPFMMDDAYKGLNAEQLDSIAQYFASQEQMRRK